MAEALGNGPKPEPKLATNKTQAKQDEENGLELLLAVLLGMGLKNYFVGGHLDIEWRKKILDTIVMETSGSLVSTTRDLIAHRITPRVWLIRMRDILVRASAAGALAILGKEEMTEEEREEWISDVNLQYGYLVQFRDQIRNATHILGDITVARADLYARAIWSTSMQVYSASVFALARSREMDVEALRHLGIADHCVDCLEWSTLDWVDVESEDYHPIGSSVCGARCQCWYEYRMVPEAPRRV